MGRHLQSCIVDAGHGVVVEIEPPIQFKPRCGFTVLRSQAVSSKPIIHPWAGLHFMRLSVIGTFWIYTIWGYTKFFNRDLKIIFPQNFYVVGQNQKLKWWGKNVEILAEA